MNQYRPSYKVTIGRTVVDPEQEALIWLETERLINGGADTARIVLGRTDGVSFKQGDDVSIALGWDGETETVFTGTLENADEDLEQIHLEAAGMQQPLLRLRQDRTFVNQKAGDILKSLTQDAGAKVEKAEAGLDFPVYAADSGRNGYEHCLRIARWCGFDISATADGKIVYAAFKKTGQARAFEYGVNVMEASFSENTPIEGAQFIPESPSSQSGADTASWLVKDSSAQAGKDGKGSAARSEPVLRTKAAAESAAKALVTFSRREARQARIRVMGEPGLDLANVVGLSSLPRDNWDGEYQVMALRHRLSRRDGFTTEIGLGDIPA